MVESRVQIKEKQNKLQTETKLKRRVAGHR